MDEVEDDTSTEVDFVDWEVEFDSMIVEVIKVESSEMVVTVKLKGGSVVWERTSWARIVQVRSNRSQFDRLVHSAMILPFSAFMKSLLSTERDGRAPTKNESAKWREYGGLNHQVLVSRLISYICTKSQLRIGINQTGEAIRLMHQ